MISSSQIIDFRWLTLTQFITHQPTFIDQYYFLIRPYFDNDKPNPIVNLNSVIMNFNPQSSTNLNFKNHLYLYWFLKMCINASGKTKKNKGKTKRFSSKASFWQIRFWFFGVSLRKLTLSTCYFCWMFIIVFLWIMQFSKNWFFFNIVNKKFITR